MIQIKWLWLTYLLQLLLRPIATSLLMLTSYAEMNMPTLRYIQSGII